MHSVSGAVLVVYVDDLLLLSHEHETAKLWQQIEKVIKFSEPPSPIGRYLGAHYNFVRDGEVSSLSIDMHDFLQSAVSAFDNDLAALGVSDRRMRLSPVDTPYLTEELIGPEDEPSGLLSGCNASHLMRVMFAARTARPDLTPAIVRLSRYITKWRARHDRALVRLFSYIRSTLELTLTGSLPSSGFADVALHVWPDADLAGDKGDTKSTGGYWIELQLSNYSWPVSWQSKRQSSTALSTAESETISLQRAMHKDALPIQEFLNSVLGMVVPIVAHEDNTQCIAACRTGYSSAMRHIGRVHRTCIGSMHELFHPCCSHDLVHDESDEQPWLNCSLLYCPSAEHKGDFFTKVLARESFQKGLHRIGMRMVPRARETSFAHATDE